MLKVDQIDIGEIHDVSESPKSVSAIGIGQVPPPRRDCLQTQRAKIQKAATQNGISELCLGEGKTEPLMPAVDFLREDTAPGAKRIRRELGEQR